MGRLIGLTTLLAFAFMGLSATGQIANYPVLLWSISSIDPVPADCAVQVAAVRNALQELDVSAARKFNHSVSRSFSWIVICNDRTWFHLKNSAPYARVNTIAGMTDFRNHVVFLNGAGRRYEELRDTVAHEMGHMLCECADEAEAGRWQQILLHEARQETRPSNAEVASALR